MTRKLFNAILTAILLLMMAVGASAQTTAKRPAIPARRVAPPLERILSYDIAAVVHKDASLTVRERITIDVTNNKVRHGITRTYPIKMRIGDDGIQQFDFEILSATLDGRNIGWHQSTEGIMTGAAFGSAKTIVPKGIHTYEITYRSTNHVRALEDHDEIYYNAVGQDNTFPVEKAIFSLTLPDGTKPLLTKAYTGKTGERGEDYRMTGDMAFATTRTLAPHEGMTVVVGWKKGIVTIPEQPWVSNHRTAAFAIILGILIAILAAAWFIWFRRKLPPIHPIFDPPLKAGFTPGTAAWVENNGETAVMLQADLVWTAVNGFTRMNNSDPDNIRFERLDENGMSKSDRRKHATIQCHYCAETIASDVRQCPFCGHSPQPQKDKATPQGTAAASRRNNSTTSLVFRIVGILFGKSKSQSIVMGYDEKNTSRPHTTLLTAWRSLATHYRTTLGALTETKIWPAILAWAIGQFCFWWILDDIWHPGYLPGADADSTDILICPALLLGLGGLFIIGLKTNQTHNRDRAVRRWILNIACVLIIIGCAYGFITLLGYDWIFIFTYLLLWALPGAFIYQFRSYLTEKGTALKVIAEGLKLYINTAERHRLDLINAPDDTVEKFEQILPYAIALNCADAWHKRFAPLLSQVSYAPDWIVDSAAYTATILNTDRLERDRLSWQELGATAAVLATPAYAVQQAIAASRATRSSSSSSGGSWSSSGGSSGSSSSGSSGGGSGGGGVGGW